MTRNQLIIKHHKLGKFSQTTIAKKFGVSQATVSGVLKAAGLGSKTPKRYARRRSEPLFSPEEWEPYRLWADSVLQQMQPFSDLHRSRSTRGLFGRYREVVYKRASR